MLDGTIAHSDFHQQISELKSRITQIIYLAAQDPLDPTRAFIEFHAQSSTGTLKKLFPKVEDQHLDTPEHFLLSLTECGSQLGFLVETQTPVVDADGVHNWACFISKWCYGDTISKAMLSSLKAAERVNVAPAERELHQMVKLA